MNRNVLLSITVAAIFGAAFRIQAAEPIKYAILIGVKEYEHPRFRPLQFAEKDVDDLGQKLRAGGFQVTQLSDTVGAKDEHFKPTRANILRELDAVLKACKRKDMVLIALSGHGLQPFGSKENFFCPFDARAQDLNTLIGMADLYDKLDRSAAETKLILADCCRDDPAAGKGITRVPLPPEGVGVLLSCSPGEQAYESKKLQHGIFYYWLLDGLNGKAQNDEGNITFGQLAEYVQRRVSRNVPEMVGEGAKQSPNLVVNISGESPLLLKGNAAKPVVIDQQPAPVNGGNVVAKNSPPPASDGTPTAAEILGAWGVAGDVIYLHRDGSMVWAFGPLYLKGVFSCGNGFLDISFPDANWDLRFGVKWADSEKKQLQVRVVDSTIPWITTIGKQFVMPQSNQAEPAAPPTRQELVGTWTGGGTTYSMNADHTFVVHYNGGQMTGKYKYNGNVLLIGYDQTGWGSLGFMAWADQKKTTVRSTLFQTTVPGGPAPGTQTDFVRVK